MTEAPDRGSTVRPPRRLGPRLGRDAIAFYASAVMLFSCATVLFALLFVDEARPSVALCVALIVVFGSLGVMMMVRGDQAAGRYRRRHFPPASGGGHGIHGDDDGRLDFGDLTGGGEGGGGGGGDGGGGGGF